jgi:hypothetical protein
MTTATPPTADNDKDNNNDNDNDRDAAYANDSDTSTVNTDDDEFLDFISSKWKDSVEVGLVIQYPLPFTNYLLTDENEAEKEETAGAVAPVVGRSIVVGGCGDENDNEEDNTNTNTNNNPSAALSPLSLSTVLEEGSIAPLFDGTQWAGTRVWKAAILGLEYLLRERQKQRQNSNGGAACNPAGSLLELGCGLGVPGMVWKQILSMEQAQQQESNSCGSSPRPPRVVLTDRDSLVPQLKENIAVNFRDDPSIEAMSLDWSREGIVSLLQHEKDTQHGPPANAIETTTAAPVFDICLNCDCVYEPLYGRLAWESLADVLSEVALASPDTLLVTALERRNGDNVEGFLERLEASGRVKTPIERVVRHDQDPHHVIEIYVTKGKSKSAATA